MTRPVQDRSSGFPVIGMDAVVFAVGNAIGFAASVRAMRAAGVEFPSTPGSYYDELGSWAGRTRRIVAASLADHPAG
jgi:hypothetical protein